MGGACATIGSRKSRGIAPKGGPHAEGKDQKHDPVRHVRGAHCRRGIHQNPRSCGALYAAIPVYHAGRPAAGATPGRPGRGGVCAAGAGGAAHLFPGRGTGVCVPAQLWLSDRLYPGCLGHWGHGPAGDRPAVHRPPAGGQSGRTGGGLPVRDGVLLGGHQLLSGHPPGAVAAASVLFSSGRAGRPVSVRDRGHGRQTAAAPGGTRKEREEWTWCKPWPTRSWRGTN